MNESLNVQIELNGKAFLIETNSSLEDLLLRIGKKSDGNIGAVAVEINAEIVPRDQFSKTMIQAGDSVEIVTLVGGG